MKRNILRGRNHTGVDVVSEAVSNIDGYDLINCIATGNVSQVWEVKQVASGQTFAMKLIV